MIWSCFVVELGRTELAFVVIVIAYIQYAIFNTELFYTLVAHAAGNFRYY
jgi:hypothetical protein